MRLPPAIVQLIVLCCIIAACKPETDPLDQETTTIYPAELIAKGIGPEFIDENRKEFYFRGSEFTNIRSYNWETNIDSVIFPGYVESYIELVGYVAATRKLYFTYSTKGSKGFYEINVETMATYNHPYLRDINEAAAVLTTEYIFYTQFSDSLSVFMADYKGNKQKLPFHGIVHLKMPNSSEIIIQSSINGHLYVYDYELGKVSFEYPAISSFNKLFDSEIGVLYSLGDLYSNTFKLYSLHDQQLVHEIEYHKNPKYYFKPECLTVFYQVIHPVGYNYNVTKIHAEHVVTKAQTIPFEIDNGSCNYIYQFSDCYTFLLGSGSNLYISSPE